MPRRLAPPCSRPGCPHRKPCPEHRTKRGSARAKGYDARWENTRREFLDEHPLCEGDDCLTLPPDQRSPAEHADHIDGLGPNGPRGHDWDNLRPMCQRCHARRTARDQPGGWNAR
ncbi:HNH endonuclease signature motif containing protein [Microbispora amethystogenes]|uniref:HNH endonuclease signature motif containing protein n=1 Tax=Microbispora amethystogenes TaxID=1427754 RepID=UPI003400EB97